jgi:hypothetical protein
MARTVAQINQVIAAAIAALQTIDSVADANTWFTKPKIVEGDYKAASANIAMRPLIAVEVRTGRDDLLGASRHETRGELELYGIVDDAENTQTALHNLLADMRLAIARAETLGALNQPPTELAWTADTAPDGLSGMGVCHLRYTFLTQWDHTAVLP